MKIINKTELWHNGIKHGDFIKKGIIFKKWFYVPVNNNNFKPKNGYKNLEQLIDSVRG